MITKTVNDKVMLNDGAYSFGKKLVQIYLPALSAAYFGFAGIWDLPYVAEVLGTVAVVSTFLGTVLGISSKQYDSSGAGIDGTVGLQPNDEGTAVNISVDPQDIIEKDSITLKVVKAAQERAKRTRKSSK